MPQNVGALGWVGWVPAILFWVAWGCLLLHCLKKKTFYPVFARPGYTKAFWLLSFLFLSPVLLIWYVLFGWLMPANRNPARWRTGLVLLPALAVVAFSLVNFWPSFPHIVVTERDPETGTLETPNAPGFEAHLGVQRSAMNTSSAMGTANSGESSAWTLASVWIQETDDHPLLREAARALHRQLAEDKTIERIGWGPPGESPPIGEQAYDSYILLSLPEIDLLGLPGRRSARGTLVADVGMMPYGGRHSVYEVNSPPFIRCGGNIKVQFDSVHTGLETSTARYSRPGEEIGKALYEKIADTTKGLKEKHGGPTEFPDYCYGPWKEAPPIPFPADAEVTQYMSAYGLLNHNHTVWTLTSDADPADFITRTHQALEAAGWTGPLELREDFHYLRMHNDEDVIWIEREVAYPLLQVEAPAEPDASRYLVHYVDRYGSDEYPPLLEKILASNPDEKLLLAFRSAFLNFGAKDAFYEHFAKRAFASVDAAMVMARYYQDREKLEQAEAVTRRAEVLSWFNPDEGTASKKTLETLLEDLHLEPLDRLQVDEAILRDLGVVFSEDGGVPIIREAAVGQPVMFRPPGGKGLWGVKVQPADGKEESQYVVIQLANGTSWETSNFTLSVDNAFRKQWSQSIGFVEGGLWYDITVERMENGQLRYTVARGDT